MAREPVRARLARGGAAPPRRLRDALLARDFARVGELAEASALAMHASAIAAGRRVLDGATLDALAAVRALRARGHPAYATIDAGPHVKVLARAGERCARCATRCARSPACSASSRRAPARARTLVEEVIA